VVDINQQFSEFFCNNFILNNKTLQHLLIFNEKTKTFFFRIITSPITWALLLTLVFVIFIGSFFHKYKVEITASGLVEKPDGMITYFDINRDGKGDQFISFINKQGKPTFKITDQDGLILDQQEYEGNAFPEKCPLAFSDLNRNGYPEVIAFIQRRDSIFLTILEYKINMMKDMIAKQFVTLVRNPKGKPDYYIHVGPYTDLDHDSVDEVIFSVIAGYPVLPRYNYIFNLKKKELLASGFTGSTDYMPYILDLNGDGHKELLVNEYAPGNLEDSLIEGKNDVAVRFTIILPKIQTTC